MNSKNLIPIMVMLDICFMLICFLGGLLCLCIGYYKYCYIFVFPLLPNCGIVAIFAYIISRIKTIPFFYQKFVSSFEKKNLLDGYFYFEDYFIGKDEIARGHKVELYIYNYIFTLLFLLLIGPLLDRFVRYETLTNSCISSYNSALGGLILIQPTLCFLGIIWRSVRTATESVIFSRINILSKTNCCYLKILLVFVLLALFYCCFYISNVYIATATFILIAMIAIYGCIYRTYKHDWSLSISLMFLEINSQWIIIDCIILQMLHSIKINDSYNLTAYKYTLMFFDIFISVLMLFCVYNLFYIHKTTQSNKKDIQA